MKPVIFLGDAQKRLRAFPPDARREAGHQIDRIELGKAPQDAKPMPSIGIGVEEIRIWEASGTFRVIYTARRADAIYILHAFRKTTQQTSKHDIALATARFHSIPRR